MKNEVNDEITKILEDWNDERFYSDIRIIARTGTSSGYSDALCSIIENLFEFKELVTLLKKERGLK